ncbi:MAG: hypothetical protein J7J89_03545 [Thermoplasmata archaeon]|nr:hypothetical protein [Thermoplasmata archaeon]RLF60852.1 MAG: hypothetical protein DRN16_04320 [Thermoplasmata archaeon]
MKRLIAIGMLAVFLLSTTLVPASALTTHIRKNSTTKLSMGGAQLDIEIVDNFCAIIKNIGDEDAYNVHWEICLRAPFLFIGGGCQRDVIEKIGDGDEKRVCYQAGLLVGFGPLVMTVTASADNAEKVTKSKFIGFLLGPLILSP